MGQRKTKEELIEEMKRDPDLAASVLNVANLLLDRWDLRLEDDDTWVAVRKPLPGRAPAICTAKSIGGLVVPMLRKDMELALQDE